jgi:hypothetical protein
MRRLLTLVLFALAPLAHAQTLVQNSPTTCYSSSGSSLACTMPSDAGAGNEMFLAFIPEVVPTTQTQFLGNAQVLGGAQVIL